MTGQIPVPYCGPALNDPSSVTANIHVFDSVGNPWQKQLLAYQLRFLWLRMVVKNETTPKLIKQQL